eukprot:1138415-Pelagomonas_calceolata.AAC.11
MNGAACMVHSAICAKKDWLRQFFSFACDASLTCQDQAQVTIELSLLAASVTYTKSAAEVPPPTPLSKGAINQCMARQNAYQPNARTGELF